MKQFLSQTPISKILFSFLLLGMCNFLQAQISGQQDVCIGDIETYSTSLTGTITWSVTPTGPALTASGSTVSVNWATTAGSYTLSANNGINTENFTVNVYAIPTPMIQYMQNACSASDSSSGGVGDLVCDTFCIGEIVTYTVLNNPGNTYLWTISGGTIISGLGTNQVQVIWNTASGFECGFLQVTEINPAGCDGKDFVRGVSAYPNGTVSISAVPNPVCLGSSITFTAATVSGGPFVSYTWNFGDASPLQTFNTNTATYTYASPGNYTVIVSASSDCCTTSDTLQITVDSLPGPDIYCITPVCSDQGGAQYCTSATGCTYNWVVTGGVITSGAGTSCITVNWGTGPAGTISLTTSGCSPALCPSTTTVTVPIMPNGSFNITGPSPVCVNSSGTYSAPYVPGSQYTWTLIPPSGPTQILPYNVPPYIQNVFFNQVGTYTLICNMVNDILECEGVDTMLIQVLPELSIFGSTNVCEGNTGSFFAYDPVFTPVSCTWNTNAPGNGTQTGTSASFIFTTAGTYFVTASAPGFCNSPDTVTVVVNPKPPVPVISGPTVLCPGGTYSFSTSGYPASTIYNWSYIDNLSNFSSGTGTSFTITTASGFTSGTITLTVTDNGCSSTTSISVSAPSAPTPVITGNSPVCPDAVETYTATLSYPGTSNVNWTISPAASGTIISGQGTGTVQVEWHSVSPNAGQNVQITVTETICNTFSGSYTLNVLIHPLPVIIASGSDFCPGTSTTLTATGGVSYQWFNSSNTPVSATVTAPGSYYVIGTDANGCNAKDYVTVNSLSQPVASISTPDLVVCDTNGNMLNTINLYALNNTGYSYVWSPGSSTSNPLPVSSTGTYSVIVTGPNGCKDTAFYTVMCLDIDTCELPICVCTNNPPTVVQGSPNCNNFGFASNSTCSGTASWSFGDATFGFGNSVTHTYSSAGYYIVCYSVIDPTCCPPPPACTSVAVPIAADFDVKMICNTLTVIDNSSVLPPESIVNWVWNFGDATTATGQNPGPHTYTSAGPFTVTLTVLSSDGCKATFSQVVNPVGPIVSASFSTTACNGPVNFTGNVISGNIVDWQWSFGDSYGSNSQNPSHIYPGPGTYLVSLTGTDAAGCTFTDTGSITILAPPPPFTLIYTSPACGSTVISVPSPGNYTSFQWLNNGTAIPGAVNSTYVVLQSGNYSVEVIDLNGCLITSNVATVVINPQPNIFITVPSPICEADAFTIQSNTAPSFSFTWDIDGNSYFSGASLNIPGYSLAPGPHIVTVIATDIITGCTDTASLTFIVNPSPIVSITNSDPSGVCSGNSITLTAVSPTAISYLWNTLSTNTSIIVNTSGNYSVTVTDIVGCMATASSLATIHPLPDLSMLPIGCDSACINPVADTIHGPPSMLNYNWEINGVTVSTNQNLILSTLNMPVFNVPYDVCLTATTLFGCVDSTCFEYTPKDCDTTACFDLEDTVYCNADGTYTLELIVTNNNTVNSTFLWIHGLNTPFTASPAYVPLSLLPGQTSAPIPITISYPPMSVLPADICYQISLYNTDSCCHDTTVYCIPVPICDPCDSISVSADSTDGCCKDISITNNYSGTYFTGVQIMPITTGASIASAILGGPYLGTWTAMGTSAQMTFTPNAGNIPLGSTPGLTNICLNLAPSTPSPQVVLVNWFTPNIYGDDSIACVDTLLFYCEAPEVNPCGEIVGTLECLEDGTYQYNYTFTNNSTYNVGMLMFTSISPAITIIPNPVLLGTPVPPSGTYTGSVIINPGIYPPGTTFCFDLTLADETGWCCHAMDSICLTLPECDSCACGVWEGFMVITDDGTTQSVKCDDDVTFAQVGDVITFISGGYSCIGDSSCTSSLSWSLSGPVSLTGVGLPSFTITAAGNYALTIYGSCGGNVCDTCTIYFVVAEDEDCECGDWESFIISDESGGEIDEYGVECGGTYSGIEPYGYISFTTGGYTCVGDSSCTSSITWNVTGPNSSSGTGLPNFPTSTAGTYTLTMYAYCGDNICDSCIITFIVEEEEDCACGGWETFGAVVDVPGDLDYSTLLDCGGSISDIPAGTNISFVAGGYLCIGDPTICESEISWNLSGPVSASGTGYPTVSLSTAGTYTLQFFGSCNGVSCDTCEITFTVIDEICDCGSWDLFTISSPTKSLSNQICGSSYNWKLNTAITISGNYNCTGSCAAVYAWSVLRNGSPYTSGSGMPVNFTPTLSGNYVVKISVTCGGLRCEVCTFKFKVKDIMIGRYSAPEELFLKVSPNPADAEVMIETPDDYGILQITDMQGRIVKQVTVEDFFMRMDIKYLDAGMYLIIFENEEIRLMEKLVKLE